MQLKDTTAAAEKPGQLQLHRSCQQRQQRTEQLAAVNTMDFRGVLMPAPISS